MKALVPSREFSPAWSAIEDIICDSLPSCVKIVLSESGYDSLLSINSINESIMFEVENFVNENRNITATLDCCFSHTYKNLEQFRFLPAHRLLILRLPFYVNKMFGPDRVANTKGITQQNPFIGTCGRKGATEYSFLMTKLIESAEENAGVAKNRYRYDEILQLFSIYIFLCSGRDCYEVLSSNLPIPSKHTVCKFRAKYL